MGRQYGYAPHRPKIIYDGDEFCEASSFEDPVTGRPVDWDYTAHNELHYNAIGKDSYTGKVYSRKAEIDYIIHDTKQALRLRDFKYTSQDIKGLRQLLEKYGQLHFELIEELIRFANPQTSAFAGQVKADQWGHDSFYFALRIDSLKTFLRYFRSLVKEYYLFNNEIEYDIWSVDQPRDEEGKPIFDYEMMPEPYLSLAFEGDTTNPITFVDAEPYDRYENPEPVKRPVYYAEWVGLPTIDVVEHEANPIGVLEAEVSR